MTLSHNHVEILKDILKQECNGISPVPRAKLYNVFEKTARSGMEQYKFARELSKMIRTGQLPEYEICMGRHGGVRCKNSLEFVTVQYEDKKIIGTVSAEKLSEFISLINTQKGL